MSTLTTLAHNVTRFLSNNAPQILTGTAVAGVVTTTVLAVRATPEALILLEDAKAEKYERENLDDPEVHLSFWETVQAAWQPYIPAASVGAITITCVIAGNSISTKRNAALLGLYSLTDTAFREYREKTSEVVGATKEQKIRDEVAKDRVAADPVTSREVIIIGGGDQLMYDQLSGRYFQSDVQSIRKAENDLNQKIINEGYASQNDFYRLIGLPILDKGDDIGWSTDMMLDLDFTTVMSSDDRACIAINYRMAPIRGYYAAFH